MSYRMGGGGGNNRNNNNNRNGGYGGGGGGYGHHMNNNGMNRPNPWGNDNMGNNRGGGGGGNFGQVGGGNGPNVGMNNDVLSLANSLVNNLLRNQNGPPSLLDLPNRGGNGGGGGGGGNSYGGRGNYGGGGGGGYDDRMNRGNRNVGSNQHHHHNNNNNNHNRRNGPPGARHSNKPDKLNVINKGGIRKRNPVSITKKVLAKNSANDSKQQQQQQPHNNSEEPSCFQGHLHLLRGHPSQQSQQHHNHHHHPHPPKSRTLGQAAAVTVGSVQHRTHTPNNSSHKFNNNHHHHSHLFHNHHHSNQLQKTTLAVRNAPSNGTKHSSNKKSKVESRYADVPNVMFYCHMCKKHMWDAASFENHVKGRTHMMMKDGVEESYRLRANMIRQEAKNEEQLKTIELERLKRLGKSAKGNQRREYCTMCDLHFFGHLSSHRKTDGHLQLKKFLHPRCGECAQEFSNRIDFDTHLLMPEHMRKAFLTKSNKPERRKNALIISTEEEERKDLKEEKEVRKQAAAAKKEAAAQAAADAAADGDEPMEEEADKTMGSETVDDEDAADKAEDGNEDGDKDGDDKADGETAVEAEDVILDFKDGDDVPVEVEGKIPKYNCTRQIGFSMLHKLDCYECHLCGRFFDTEITAEIHSRTVTHHRNFVKFLNDKSNDTKIAEKRAAAAIEESERKKRKLMAAQNKEASKAAAVAAAAAAVAAASAVTDETSTEDVKDVTIKTEEGDQSYDPLEASVEDELEECKTEDDTMNSQDDELISDETLTDLLAEDSAEVDEPEVENPEVKVEITVEPPRVATPPAPTIRTPARGTPGRTPRGRGRGGRK